MSGDTEELVRLLAVNALWPSVGREEFKTELHLRQGIRDEYEKLELRRAAKTGDKTMRPQKEIEEMMDKAGLWTDEGATAVRGMTYEEGVANALRWALGDSDDDPIEEEYDEEAG